MEQIVISQSPDCCEYDIPEMDIAHFVLYPTQLVILPRHGSTQSTHLQPTKLKHWYLIPVWHDSLDEYNIRDFGSIWDVRLPVCPPVREASEDILR